MPLSAADATQYERAGYFILRNALPADLLGRLNETFDREIERHLSEADRDAGWRGTAFTRDGKYSPLVPGEVTNDNHRFRFECVNHDMPDGSRFWSPEFIRLIDLPGVIDIVTELACDGEHWGHLGARGSGQGFLAKTTVRTSDAPFSFAILTASASERPVSKTSSTISTRRPSIERWKSA